MARSFGRILASIWDDDDFQARSPTAQRMYLFLLSQSDLEHSGIIPLRERRWAKACTALTVDQVRLDLKELAEARFVVVDEETEELLVRSLIRRDEVWKQPNVFKAAATSAMASQSPAIKAVLYAEIVRLDLSAAAVDSRRVRESLLASLGLYGNPSGTPREPFADPSLREGGSDMGKGNSNGSSNQFPHSPIPDPLSTSAADAADAPKREDVERLCTRLADRIEANGANRPTITEKWRDSARLLMDKDGKTEAQVAAAIDWCQADEFWRANILSMPKLREKYEQLRLQATRTPASRRSTTDDRVAQAQALKDRFRANEQPPLAIEGGAA